MADVPDGWRRSDDGPLQRILPDVANWSWVRTHRWSGVAIGHLPNLQRWLDQIAARPATQKGIAVPYEIKTMDHGQGDEARQLGRDLQYGAAPSAWLW